MKLLKKLRKRWQAWRFQKQKPEIYQRQTLLKEAILQGKMQRFKECE